MSFEGNVQWMCLPCKIWRVTKVSLELIQKHSRKVLFFLESFSCDVWIFTWQGKVSNNHEKIASHIPTSANDHIIYNNSNCLIIHFNVLHVYLGHCWFIFNQPNTSNFCNDNSLSDISRFEQMRYARRNTIHQAIMEEKQSQQCEN